MARATRRLGHGGFLRKERWSPLPAPRRSIGFPANDNRPSPYQRTRSVVRTVVGLILGAVGLYLFGG
ncbi:MAG: hypothetical protein EXQ94_01355 [Alphaproteobacteria bacterium]|nr:hypothetical protein [Alphaproteobacteria bacterium]